MLKKIQALTLASLITIISYISASPAQAQLGTIVPTDVTGPLAGGVGAQGLFDNLGYGGGYGYGGQYRSQGLYGQVYNGGVYGVREFSGVIPGGCGLARPVSRLWRSRWHSSFNGPYESDSTLGIERY